MGQRRQNPLHGNENYQSRRRRVRVLVADQVHLLDLGGPVQAIYEANCYGADYELSYVSSTSSVRSAQGLELSDLQGLPEVDPDDWILVPGTDSGRLDTLDVPVDWLRDAVERGARVCSVCSGAFTLAKAGILEGRECTTHWQMIDRLRQWSPSADVHENRLFVKDENVITSAGVASGIDMALHLISTDWGPKIAAQVARELVVYIRRSGDAVQQSIYLEHRSHIHPAIHRVQDYIIEHPELRPTIDELADVAALSPRHLTRLFRESTGTTLKAFGHRVKLQVAQNLAENPDLTIESIARKCGFQDGRQLRRLWRSHLGSTLRDTRIEARRSAGRAAR